MLYRIWSLLKEAYHYEKHSTLDSDYLRQVLTLAVVVLFALNLSCNGLGRPVVFVLTGLICLVLLMVEWLLPRAKNEKHLVMFSNTALIVMGLLLLVLNENDGFQNLWFFLMPATLFVQSGLPIGLPFCTAYGLAATCFLWLGPLAGSTLYRRDYALFYPAAYWSFCLLMITADIFYKHYRIRQEQSEKEMEREVRATICEARQLMVSSVAAISQMIDEKDRYTSEHSHRVAEYARLIGAHMGFAGEELDSLYRSALLHDIGRRYGKRHLGHVLDGYRYMLSLGYDEVARVCLSHSFNNQSLADYVGRRDTTPEETKIIADGLDGMAYDEYDRLIQLCDSLAGADGVMDIIERMEDIRRRYGDYPQNKWDINLAIKAHFEALAGRDIYDIVGQPTARR